ncbi:MAG: uroporphyrinogen decarboxylase family protein, partial [Candidatus Rokuibacteriota bacterium]
MDRPPYAFWRHFPTADRSPAALAQATLRFHDRYGSDLLVVAPPAGYAAQAWGCVEADTPRADGSRPCARCAVARPEDWGTIRALDPAGAPGYAEVVETLVRVGFDRRIGDAPVLVLLPSPSTVAARLGGGRLAAHLREWPGLVGDALRALAETQIRFAELCLAEGLAGVLYA